MINKVILEGEIIRGSWGKGEESGFFVIIKQDIIFNKFATSNYFSIYANNPLAKELSEIVEHNIGASIIIEGKLKTYFSKKDHDWKTTTMIEKIIEWKKQEEHQDEK